MSKLASFLTCLFALLYASLAVAQGSPEGVALSNDEATSFIKGKRLTAVRVAGGNPSLQFRDDGTMYGNNAGSSDSGKWRIEDGKLCMAWRNWEYEGCGKLMRVGQEIHHLYASGTATHLIFKP